MGGKSSTIVNTAPRIAGLQLQTSAYGRVIPIIYGTQRIAANIFWYDDFVATPHTETQTSGGKGGGGVTSSNTTYTYTASLMFGLCEGQINSVGNIWADKELKTLANLGFTFFNGSYGQGVWGFLTSNHPDKAINYRGQAYLANALFNLGDNASLPNLTYEVKGLKLYNSTDANPKEVIYDFLTNVNYGAGFPASKIGDLTQYNNYCLANNLLMSPMFDEQKAANEHIEDFLKATNSAFIWSEGVLKIVPYGDSVATANGVTFTPNTTPVYDLTDDDYIDIDEPIKVTRSTNADAYNHIKIEFLNRSNAYNAEIAESKDLANIDLYGLRPSDSIQIHSVCDSATAKKISQIMLQRTLYVRNKYDLKVSWKYCLLEPMDLITLTDSKLGFDKLTVRVTEIKEDDEGILSITAEEWPFGIASATLYPNEQAQGTAMDYNVPSGNINPAVIFEPPLLLSNNYEIWVGLSGGINWGGCDLYVSFDNSSYAYLTTVLQPTRTGYTSANWESGNIVSVDLTESRGTLISTESGALALVGGEIIRYTTATLTAQYKYDLTVTERGLYKSTQATHAIGSRFERLDSSITKQPFTVDMIGKTIYYKALSFNIYGVAKQAMEDVDPFTFVIQGDLYPPSDIDSLSASEVGNVFLLTWTHENIELDFQEYVIYLNSVEVGRTKIKSFEYFSRGLDTKSFTVKVCDTSNALSDGVSINTQASAPEAISNLAIIEELDDWALSWSYGYMPTDFKTFQIYQDNDLVGETSGLVFKAKINKTQSNFRVIAIDTAGNQSTYTQQIATITPLNDIASVNSSYLNNNILMFWDKISTTRTPIFYEIKKGNSWENAQFIEKTTDYKLNIFSNGTYMIKATYQYSSGLKIESENPKILIVDEAQLLKNVLVTWNEFETNWSGTLTNTQINDDGYLTLVSTDDVDEYLDVDSIINFDYGSEIISQGVYEIPLAHNVSLAWPKVCTLSYNLELEATSVRNDFDALLDVDSVNSIDGYISSDFVVEVQISTSQDGINFGDYSKFIAGDYLAQAFKFRLVLSSFNQDVTPIITNFEFTVDMPDLYESGNDVSNTSIKTITYQNNFSTAPDVQITIVNAMVGDDAILTNQTDESFDIIIKNSGTNVVRTFNYFVKGY